MHVQNPYEIIFLSRARKELVEAWQWYEEKKQGLGDRLLDEIEFTLALIENNPESFPTKRKLYREVKTKVFPYLLIYRFDKSRKKILISSVFHGKRNPKKKYKR